MTVNHRRQFIYGQLGLMLGAAALLSLLGVLTVEAFYLVSFVGLLMLVELTSPPYIQPRWQARLRWVILIGLVGCCYVAVSHIQRLF